MFGFGFWLTAFAFVIGTCILSGIRIVYANERKNKEHDFRLEQEKLEAEFERNQRDRDAEAQRKREAGK